MRTRRMLWHALTIALTACVVVACGGTPTPIPPTQTPAPPVAKSRCGDGICDEAERSDPKLCPQDCAPPPTQTPPPPAATAIPPTPTPKPPPPTPTAPRPSPTAVPPTPAAKPEATKPAGKCGDGVCDEAEKKDPKLCPQDCAALPTAVPAATKATTPPATGAPDYEPPINVMVILHIDPGGELGADFKVDEGFYQRTRKEILWLMDEAKRHGVKLTSLYNGWYTKWAVDHNDTGQFRDLVTAGHEVGSHAHSITYDSTQDIWLHRGEEVSRWGSPVYNSDVARQSWSDADKYLEAALSASGVTGQNQTMCAVPFIASEEGLFMSEFGFSFASGNRSEKGDFHFGHTVWNPWRPAASDRIGEELKEDLNAKFIAVDHYAQIGAAQEAHAGIDVTAPGIKMRFLMLYTEWLSRERHGAQDKVWTFGFVYHPNVGDKYNAALSDFLSWLDQYFIGKKSPYGNTIARYATVSDIGREYLAWEKAHPGVSSFTYVGRDPYPYTYATVPTMLKDATYEAHVSLGQGVSCFRLRKAGKPIYLMWSNQGQRTVDFSVQVSGQVRVTDAAGKASTVSAATLSLTEEPLFVEPMN